MASLVGAAAAVSALQLRQKFSNTPGDRDEFFGPLRWKYRTFGVFFIWASFIAYAAFLAPGRDPAGKELDMQLINTAFSAPFTGALPAAFEFVFNSLGIWPLVYAATLLPGSRGQSPVPAWPFVGASFLLGAFALSPYLALREFRGRKGDVVQEDLDWITRYWLEGRINAVLALGGALYLILYALGNGSIGAVAPDAAFTAFLPVFMGSSLPHVSSIDYLVLWMFYSPVLLEDGRRRGLFAGPFDSWSATDQALFVTCAGLPVVGGCTWLLLRPPLPEGREGDLPPSSVTDKR